MKPHAWSVWMFALGSPLALGAVGCDEPAAGPQRVRTVIRTVPAEAPKAAPAPSSARTQAAAQAQARDDSMAYAGLFAGPVVADPFRSGLHPVPALDPTTEEADDPEPGWGGHGPYPAAPPPLDRYTLDELKPTATVTGTVSPSAILTDPTGHGHLVGVGDLVGKRAAQVVRITSSSVVLSRYDPKSGEDLPIRLRKYPRQR